MGHTKLQETGIAAAGEEHIRVSNANNLEHGSGPTLVLYHQFSSKSKLLSN